MSIAAKIKHINGTNRRWQSQKKKALPSAEAHDCLHSELDSQQRIGQQQLNARTNVNGDAGLYLFHRSVQKYVLVLLIYIDNYKHQTFCRS